VFYSSGGYNEIFFTLGEYYLPCHSYTNNTVWEYHPFSKHCVKDALNAWEQLREKLFFSEIGDKPTEIQGLLEGIGQCDKSRLKERAERLHNIIGGRISVLPPDARHVDYEVIPLMISDGCLYHCEFCCVKTRNPFQPRSKENISCQIRELKRFYGSNLKNYNALFLGNHDALAAGGNLICESAQEAFDAFEFSSSHMKRPTLHLFGSVDSLLNTSPDVFRKIDNLPFKTYINIGLESGDAAALTQIGKPISVQDVEAAFGRLRDVNQNYSNIEVTANFVIGDKLPPDHYQSLIELTVKTFPEFTNKGGIYISPLIKDKNKRELLRSFIKLKSMCRLPTYLYLIHRL